MYRRYFWSIFGTYQWYFTYYQITYYQLKFAICLAITNLNCVYISYTPQRLCYYNANYSKTLFYSGNAYKNGFLNIFSTGNLLNSRMLWQSRACAKEQRHTIYMSTQTFSTQFTTKDINFLHFWIVSSIILSKTYRNECWMNKNGHTSSDSDAC